jgi:general secretion pathway protein F
MPVFTYKAFDVAAGIRNGTVVADTPRAARDMLRQRGLRVGTVSGQRGSGRSIRGSRRRYAADANSFIRELSTLLGVGIPLLEAIDTLAQQYRGGFRDCLLRLRDRISQGGALAEAMADQPAVFDVFFITLTEVGESAGTLDVVLDRLADFKERSATLKDRVVTALIYPAVVLTMALGVCIFLMTCVVPKLLSGLIETGQPVPGITRVVKGVSDFLVSDWWMLLGAVAIIVFSLTAIMRTARGRFAWHRIQLRIPLIGDMIRKQAILRLCVVLETLLRSGVVFVRAIQIARRTISNEVMRDALGRCEQAVGGGRDIGQALAETGAFPPAVVQVFAVGQQSGRLEEMLERLARDYDRQLTSSTARLTALLEPALILFLVTIVAFIAIATILPMLEAANVMA